MTPAAQIVECRDEDLLAIQFCSGWSPPERVGWAQDAYASILDAVQLWVGVRLLQSGDVGRIVSTVWTTDHEGKPGSPEALGQIRLSLIWSWSSS